MSSVMGCAPIGADGGSAPHPPDARARVRTSRRFGENSAVGPSDAATSGHARDGQGAATVVLGTDTLKGDDVIHCLKSTHVRLEMPRREDVFMSKAANCCAEHGVLSLEEKMLPVSRGDPCARVLWHQFPPVTRGLQLSIQQLRPWPISTAGSH